MSHRNLVRLLALGSVPLTMGAMPPSCSFGGLNAVSFVPGGDTAGHLYLGTGNYQADC